MISYRQIDFLWYHFIFQKSYDDSKTGWYKKLYKGSAPIWTLAFLSFKPPWTGYLPLLKRTPYPFVANLIFHLFSFFLFPIIFLYRCSTKVYYSFSLSSIPKLSLPPLMFQICVPFKLLHRSFSLSITHHFTHAVLWRNR